MAQSKKLSKSVWYQKRILPYLILDFLTSIKLFMKANIAMTPVKVIDPALIIFILSPSEMALGSILPAIITSMSKVRTTAI